MRILIVEDEEALASGLTFNFEQEGYQVVHASNGHSALDHFQNPDSPVDLVILDLMLPGMSGYETCRAMRELDEHVPILVLSARTLSEDKTLAFECGTDQYMTKPFALPELLSRVRNLIERRTVRPSSAAVNGEKPNETFRFGNVEVDFNTYQLTVNGETHDLTKLELELLRYFVDNAGFVLSRAEILEDVWGERADLTTRSIDNFVMRLRKLIEPDAAEPRHILSVRGTGYRFITDPDSATSGEETT